ncbi:MAG: aspartyl/asparaginyl beta-hydroxylase domain-containing protein [Actinomycetota bacterium]|nr:aspartyl/asparaginyl beta-hydroxylase domain-containing protein [Actinomycetota bacterium]
MTADDPLAPPSADDAVVARLIAFLRHEGADARDHAGERTLIDHLIGTYEVLRRWEQPAAIAHAALIHSVYGTDVYARPLLPLSRRPELIALAGEEVERLAYLFSVTPRGPLFAGTHAWLRDLPRRSVGEPGAASDPPASRDESDALIVLHMANLAEQTQARDGSPGKWLAKLRELAEVALASDAVTLPGCIAELAPFTAADEEYTRELYRAGLAEGEVPVWRRNRLALAAATCPVVPEPCVWLAHLSRCRRDAVGASSWARLAQRRLQTLGTAWDKRLTFGEWGQLARRLDRPGVEGGSPAVELITDPGALFAARCQKLGGPVSPSTAPARIGRVMAPEEAAGRKRFYRYVDTLVDATGGTAHGTYPDLESRPWHDASDFPLASYLESHFEAIRDEVLALEGARFHRESERLQRTGDWDVAFFYERGRRRDEVCEACPVTTHGIETLPALRTAAGLIYVSRMRPKTHIRPHRGPTNLRLRCHLGIMVPDGDCALRVGDAVRPWQEGRCLVFDDSVEHEAWNQTSDDRIVLVVDLWHPGLSATEVQLLEGLQSYASDYGRRLHRYWAANAAASVSSTGA